MIFAGRYLHIAADDVAISLPYDPGRRPPLYHARSDLTATCWRSRRSSPSSAGSLHIAATRKMVVPRATIIFATSSRPLRRHPDRSAAEPCLIFFRLSRRRVLRSCPAAAGDRLESFVPPVAERCRGDGIFFFGIAAADRSVFPIAAAT